MVFNKVQIRIFKSWKQNANIFSQSYYDKQKYLLNLALILKSEFKFK